MNTHVTPAPCDRPVVRLVCDTACGLASLAVLAGRLDLAVERQLYRPDLPPVSEANTAPMALIVRHEDLLAPFLEDLSRMPPAARLPTVIYANADALSLIDTAVSSAVDVFLADTPSALNLRMALRFAQVQHRAATAVRRELDKTRRRLAERAVIERAKLHLMQTRALREEAAHHMIRTAAMRDCTTMGSVARRLMDAADASDA